MEAVAYTALKTLQDRHWWFDGRRQILSALIRRFIPHRGDLKILEAGCGYGGNLPMLAQFGTVDCFEFDNSAREYAAGLLGRPVAYGHLPDQPGFEDRQFDLVAMLDVLEHIDDDVGSLKSLGGLLSQSGRILITVPAMPWLWSKHDEVHHHKRRYTKRSLNRALRAAGLEPVRIGYFNSILFPLAVAQRFAQKIRNSQSPVDELPPRPLNSVLAKVFAFERKIVGKIPMPIGLSLFAIAELTDE